jgi:hypothetical protein
MCCRTLSGLRMVPSARGRPSQPGSPTSTCRSSLIRDTRKPPHRLTAVRPLTTLPTDSHAGRPRFTVVALPPCEESLAHASIRGCTLVRHV